MTEKICNMALLSPLRFIASVFVVLFHCRTRSEFLADAPRIVSAGPQMVTFFFVLSGFSLMLAYARKTEFSQKEYWTNRMVRIVPVYLIGIVLALIVNPFAGKEFTLAGLLLHLVFAHALVPPYPLSINGPAWFMSVVVVFYALFPPILSAVKKHKPRPLTLFAAALLLWAVTQTVLYHLIGSGYYQGFPSVSHDLIYYFPLVHLGSFLMGITAAYAVMSDSRFHLSGFWALGLFILSVAAVTLAIEHQAALTGLVKSGFPFGSSFYAPFFLLIIVSCSMLKGRIAGFMALPFWAILGEISFGVYMIQIPVRCVTSFVLEKRDFTYDQRMMIFLAVLIALGFLLTYAVERPFRLFIQQKNTHT